MAIGSHLLQRSGIVSKVSENEKLYVLEYDAFSKDNLLFVFKERGRREAFVFPGFCNLHDSSIFSSIEQDVFDLKDYKTQLLFSYQAAVDEIRKKEYFIELYSRLLNDPDFEHAKDYFAKSIYELSLGISHTEQSRALLISNIEDSNRSDFCSIVLEVPKVEVCACGVYTFETTMELSGY